METKEIVTGNRFNAIKLALSKILDNKGGSSWISVRDFPIGNLFKENGLGSKYSSAAIEVLRKHSYVQFEGERSGMKFRVSCDNYDLDYLSASVLDLVESRQKEYKESSKNNPIRRTKKSLVDFDNNSEVKTLRRVNIPQLGDLRYSVINNKIMQVRIISVSLVNVEGVEKTLYEIEYSPLTPNVSNCYLKNVNLSFLFEDVDSVLQNLKKNVVLYTKPKQ